jgi:hypothetical protein
VRIILRLGGDASGAERVAYDAIIERGERSTADSLLVYKLRPVRSHGILVNSAFLVKT